MSAPLDLTLAGAARAVASGEVSARELVEASLTALDREGGRLNAVAELRADAALASAEACDAKRSRGEELGPLHGVPMAHKDMFYRAGWGCASGSRLRAGFVPNETATVLQRLDAAGAIDLGRLNMVEFALGLTGHNAITGHPRNPWNLEHITGGSSSGPVASVAARLTFASLGSDTGGSIRVPAACTNLVGIKPTYGRVSRAACLPLSQSLDHIGPLTRTAEDAALLLEVMAGHDSADPTSSRRHVPAYRQALCDDLKGQRIGIARPPFELAVSDEVAALLGMSEKHLVDLGAELVDIQLPPMERYNAMRRVLILSEAAARHRDFVEAGLDQYNPQTMARMLGGYLVSATDYLRAASWRATALREFVADIFTANRIDILHLPAMPEAVSRIDAHEDGGGSFVTYVNALGHFICPFNYLGLPAVSVPIGLTGNGLPNAMQLVGRPYAEVRLLRAAHAFDIATGYSRMRPSRLH